jgi:uncharacterized UBP type Zn finger protein
MQRFKDRSDVKFLVIRYNDFVADVETHIRNLYDWMQLPLSDAFRRVVEQVVKANQAFESDNVYTLDELGLSVDLIRKEFAEVFDLFQFDQEVQTVSVMQ